MTTLSRDRVEAQRELEAMRRKSLYMDCAESYADEDKAFTRAMDAHMQSLPAYDDEPAEQRTVGQQAMRWALLVLGGLFAWVVVFWLFVWAWDVVVIEGLLK